METFNTRSDEQAKQKAAEAYGPDWPSRFHAGRRSAEPGRTAVWQARLVLLVMINVAQLWILAATIEAALAREFSQLIPLISASVVCWIIALTIFLWWKPASRKRTSTGYLRK
ncbi:MAG: hypothetical protein IT174_07930 [Acidobacteria bacterium]|nr:hypothetical protein [Acidobacteriota bacterium]